MKVEFTVEEAHRMFEAVMDDLLALKLSAKDKAAIRRWRAQEMTAGQLVMQNLARKINEEVQRSHDRAEVSQIKKPDWI